jgi:hypothetical protein
MYNIIYPETLDLIQKIFTISMIIMVLIVFGWWLTHLTTSTNDFYKKAQLVEDRIFAGDNQDEVEIQLRSLDKEGWHRTHSDRIHELAKLFQLKYNKNIIKK